MSRPDARPLRRLPELAPRQDTLERCVFCPKLCRSACPVSNAEPRETVTPWGKMSMAYFTANGSVAQTPSYAAPAWACSGCFGCREQCDHENDVTGTLFDARSALMRAGVAPPEAKRLRDRFPEIEEANRAFARTLGGTRDAETAVLVGCAYRKTPQAAEDAVRAVAEIAGEVTVVDTCCGAPLLHAGDKARFLQQGELLAATLKHHRQVVVVDAGCASTIRVHHAHSGITFVPTPHFTEFFAEHLDRLAPIARDGNVRWHDPCQLGRGLGVYDAPRAILGKILGRPAAEFVRSREDARCSGAGGGLPITMPETSRAMARQRLADGEGAVVTGCASSVRAFHREGAEAIDIASLVLASLRRKSP